MKNRIGILCLAALSFFALTLHAQTIPQQIDTILAGSGISDNSWSILIANETGSVNYYQRTPNTGYAPSTSVFLLKQLPTLPCATPTCPTCYDFLD